MAPRCKITLTPEERGQLETMTRGGKSSAAKFVHARALLLCDAGPHGDPWKVADVAAALGVTARTVEHLKQRFVEEGLILIRFQWETNYPRLGRDASDSIRIRSEAWQALLQLAQDAGHVGEHPVGEFLLAQLVPEMFLGIELGRIGGQAVERAP